MSNLSIKGFNQAMRGETPAPTKKELTKAELIEIAKELEIKGFSGMNKPKLIEAIATRQAELAAADGE